MAAQEPDLDRHARTETDPMTGMAPGGARVRSGTGELDLQTMLRSLTVSRRSGRFTMSTLEKPVELGSGVEAVIAETEAVTVVATVETALANGWPFEFEAAWLTLDVHSSLAAVGLTAAVSQALTAEGIACNVIAGYHHDHILVPLDRADDAIAALVGLRDGTP